MDYKDYYKTLGISKKASQEEIRNAFRKLARKYHPDANKGDKQSEEKFKEINEAYQVLSDPEKRTKYDQFGSQWQQYQRGGGRPEDFDWGRWTSGPGTGYTRTMSPDEFEQIFGGSFNMGGLGGFSDFFETLFGGGGRRTGTRNRPLQGHDLEQAVEITLEEAYRGTTRTFQREDGKRFEVKIPKGVRTGSRVRIPGKGAGGPLGGKSGDLYLKVKVIPHPAFKRERNNLRVTIPIDLYTAVLGGEVKVPTLERSVLLTIPPETSNGRTFRLRGLGMPHLRKPDKHGDLLATVEVQIPANLSPEEKQLFERLKALREKKTRRG